MSDYVFAIGIVIAGFTVVYLLAVLEQMGGV